MRLPPPNPGGESMSSRGREAPVSDGCILAPDLPAWLLMNYVVVAIPYFILAMLVELFYGKLVNRHTYRLADTVNSLQLGTLSRLVDVLRLGFSAVVFGALVKWL